MPSCSVINCKNHSKTANLSNGGVSYHRFPQDPHIKEKWIDATARENWMPSATSTICSEHFNKKDILISRKGHRFVNDKAFPVKKLFIFHDPDGCEESKADIIKSREKISSPNSISDTITEMSCKDNDPEYDSDQSTNTIRRKKKLEKKFNKNLCIIKTQMSELNDLRSRNRRVKRKIRKSDILLQLVQERFSISEAELNKLKTAALKIGI